MATFTFILRGCPDTAKTSVAQLLGKAFSLKDSTCVSIADSAPIVLLPELTREEAAVMQVVLSGFSRLGATVEFSTSVPEELPKIDWPRRPQVFKREISEHLADFQLNVPVPGGQATLLSLVVGAFLGITPGEPQQAPPSTPSAPSKANEFRGIQLPEITPFGGVAALPPAPTKTPPSSKALPNAGNSASASASSSNDEALSRLNELFPEDESSGFLPNNQDITSILNKLLPDEEGGGSAAPAPGGGTGTGTGTNGTSGRRAALTPNLGSGGHAVLGHAVFLAKIADEGRRQKAVPLIAELAKITTEEAEVLSKKVIIPVLKGATQADAENAKQRFAKIGILARVKGPE